MDAFKKQNNAQKIEAVFEPVGVAMLGLGRWSRQLARAIIRTPSLRLITGYSRNEENRLRFAAEFGCDSAPTLEAALTHPGWKRRSSLRRAMLISSLLWRAPGTDCISLSKSRWPTRCKKHARRRSLARSMGWF